MAKFFCPSCEGKILTFSLRYLDFNLKKWKKPKGEMQYCEKCKSQYPTSKCKTMDDKEGVN